MRINLIHFVQNLATTTVPQIQLALGLQDKPGNCALGLNMADMMQSCPNNYKITYKNNRMHITPINNEILDYIKTIGDYLGIPSKDCWKIVHGNDTGMTFKEISIWIRDNLLTDEERKLLKSLDQELEKVLCLK